MGHQFLHYKSSDFQGSSPSLCRFLIFEPEPKLGPITISLCKSDALLAIKNAISSCLEAAIQPTAAAIFLVHIYVALPHFICIWEPSMYCLCSSNSIVAESADQVGNKSQKRNRKLGSIDSPRFTRDPQLLVQLEKQQLILYHIFTSQTHRTHYYKVV